jgi:hypothetical protein
MARVSFREINTASTGASTGAPFGLKCLALLARYGAGFTNPTQSVSSGDYWGVENSSTGVGSINISGSDKNFRDNTGNPFVVGDEGKYLLIVDPTNRKNIGIYKIPTGGYVSASTVTLDFRSGAAEYPVQNLSDNMDWYLFADNYQVPVTDGDYFRLQTPHAYGWEIEVAYIGAASDKGFQIRIATDGSWGSARKVGPVYAGVDDSDVCWFYADVDGDHVFLWLHNSTNNQFDGIFSGNITEFDSDRVDSEKVIVLGCADSTPGTWDGISTIDRLYPSTNAVSSGFVWNDNLQKQQPIFAYDLSYRNSNESFTMWTSKQVNHRTSNWEFIEGQPYAADVNTVEGEHEKVGKLAGIFRCPTTPTSKTAYDDDGTRDKYVIQKGFAVNWDGWTQQH